MLDKVCFARAVLGYVVHKFAHYFELMVAGEVEGAGGQGIGVFSVEAHEVLNDIGQAVTGQYLIPQVGGFMSVGTGWVSFAVVVSQIEGQEIGSVTVETGEHIDFVRVGGKVYDATTKVEEGLRDITVVLILVLGMNFGILACPCVFEFHGDDGYSVEEEYHVYFLQGIGLGISELTSFAELVFLEVFFYGAAARFEWQLVKEGEVCVVYIKPFFE